MKLIVWQLIVVGAAYQIGSDLSHISCLEVTGQANRHPSRRFVSTHGTLPIAQMHITRPVSIRWCIQPAYKSPRYAANMLAGWCCRLHPFSSGSINKQFRRAPRL